MNEKPTHLDLFSGIGGFALAAKWAGFRTIGFCEIDKYCCKVLAKNFLADAGCERRNEVWSKPKSDQSISDVHDQRCSATIYGNIRDLDGKQFTGVTLITGGFPCQPFSCAGKRRGKADDRHLWPEMLRLIAEAMPTWVLGENVAGIIGMELDAVLSDLEAIGYTTRPFVIPACGVDARHRRNRVWIVAHAEKTKRQWSGDSRTGRDGFADSSRISDTNRWLPEPDMGRVAHGIPNRVDRLKGLGNAIVPQVAYQILKEIRQLISKELI